MEFYHIDKNHPRYNMPPHWHTECEIIRILEGELLISIGDEKFLANQGDILFIHDGILHSGIPYDCVYESIVFDMKLLLKQNHACTKIIQDIIHHKISINHKLDNNVLKFNCDYLFESIKNKHFGYEFVSEGYLYVFLGIILENNLYRVNHNIHKKTQEKIDNFEKVLRMIEENYGDNITLNDLSKKAGMTPKYFCKFFHEMTNKTPIEYLNLYRIESACEQILSTDLSISHIAINCGFNDVSYFIKTFKKHKGVTPKKYLKNSKGLL